MRFIICLCFVALIFTFSQPLVAEENDRNLIKARKSVQSGLYEKAEKYFKRSLKGNKDPKVLLELATLYEIQKKYYLAGLAFRQLGMTGEFNKMEQLRLASFKDAGSPEVWESAKKQSELFSKAYKRKRAAAISMGVFGAVSFTAGLTIFIFDNVVHSFGGYASYPLMLSGLSLIEGGLLINHSANYSSKVSVVFNKISSNYYDAGTTSMEYYNASGIKESVRKTTSGSLYLQGLTLSLFSIPLFVISIYSLVEASISLNKALEEANDEDNQCLGCGLGAGIQSVAFGFQFLYLIFPITSLTAGLVMIARSSQLNRMNPEESLFTLNSIAPMINPFSKTYGLALGFSF